jgi:hypothetical protein
MADETQKQTVSLEELMASNKTGSENFFDDGYAATISSGDFPPHGMFYCMVAAK